MKTWTAIVVLAVLAGAAGGCDETPTQPTPTPTPTPTPIVLVQFADTDPMFPAFSTPNVRDVHEEIVHFDTGGRMYWTATGQAFPGFPATGYFLRADRFFQVRFGTKNGERRAYFTEAGRATICDIAVVNGQLVISGTDEPVPGGG